LFLTLLTAPDSVQNIQLTFLIDSATYNNMSRIYDLNFTISWEEPLEPGGEILAYSYRLVETNPPANVTIMETNTTMTSVTRGVSVSPFTNYTATVVAYTSAGRGTEEIITTSSPEAGEMIRPYLVMIQIFGSAY